MVDAHVTATNLESGRRQASACRIGIVDSMSGDPDVNYGDGPHPFPDFSVAKRQAMLAQESEHRVFENQFTKPMVPGIPVRWIPNIDSVRPPATLVAGCLIMKTFRDAK
jgi:hypothetical protein